MGTSSEGVLAFQPATSEAGRGTLRSRGSSRPHGGLGRGDEEDDGFRLPSRPACRLRQVSLYAAHDMVFTKRLREGVRRGRIKCSVRVWTRPHVKVGGRYPMDEGQIVVDSITPMRLRDITNELARESGFLNVKDLLETAKHGRGKNVYLVRFHYLPAGAWDVARTESNTPPRSRTNSQLLRRIRRSASPRLADDDNA